MTRTQLLALSVLAMLAILFHSQLAVLLSGDPATFTLLGIGLIVTAHQLRRHYHKPQS
jgi:hypothetical protein